MEFDSTKAESWEPKAALIQQYYYSNFGDRTFDRYTEDEYAFLKTKIAFVMYGMPVTCDAAGKLSSDHPDKLPKNVDDGDSSTTMLRIYDCYTKEQRKRVQAIFDQIMKLQQRRKETVDGKTEWYDSENLDECDIAFIFVVYQVEQTSESAIFPVFRVLRHKADPVDEAWFVDHKQRVYENWQGFLDNNQIPAGRICYPRHGYYSSLEMGYSKFDINATVVVDYCETPAARLPSKVLEKTDTVSTVTLVGALVVGAAGALGVTIAAPLALGAAVAGGAASLYSGARSAATLIDRKRHEQTIGIKDAEARSAIISVAGATIGIAAVAATAALQQAVQLGQVVGRPAVYAFNGLNVGTLIVGGAGTANQAYYVYKKFRCGQKVTIFDVMNLSMSIFLFQHSLLSFRTANAVIQEMQQKDAGSAAPAPADGTDKPAGGTGTGGADAGGKDGASEGTGIGGGAGTGPKLDGEGLQTAAQELQSAPEVVFRNTAGDILESNARVIRTMSRIKNPKEFFAKTVAISKQVNRVGEKVVYGDAARANPEEKVHPPEPNLDTIANRSSNSSLATEEKEPVTKRTKDMDYVPL